MLAYLDQLCTALLARDARATARLLGHPLAAALPAPVRDEAEAVAELGGEWRGTPLAALRCYHQTGQLLRAPAAPADAAPAAARATRAGRTRAGQIELPLSAA
jgi:hypothetical protein